MCAVKDVWSNRIVGYSIDSRMKPRLAVQALDNAVATRTAHGMDVAGCIVPSGPRSSVPVAEVPRCAATPPPRPRLAG